MTQINFLRKTASSGIDPEMQLKEAKRSIKKYTSLKHNCVDVLIKWKGFWKDDG